MLLMTISYILIDPIIVSSAPCRNLPRSNLQDHSIFSHIKLSKTTLDGKNFQLRHSPDGLHYSSGEQWRNTSEHTWATQITCMWTDKHHKNGKSHNVRFRLGKESQRSDMLWTKTFGGFSRTWICSKHPVASAMQLPRVPPSLSILPFRTQPPPDHSPHT